MLRRKCQGEGDVPLVIEHLREYSGIEVADLLSIKHILHSIESISGITKTVDLVDKKVVDFDNDIYAQALMSVSLKVKTRKH